jgi:hypothetical protein
MDTHKKVRRSFKQHIIRLFTPSYATTQLYYENDFSYILVFIRIFPASNGVVNASNKSYLLKYRYCNFEV